MHAQLRGPRERGKKGGEGRMVDLGGEGDLYKVGEKTKD